MNENLEGYLTVSIMMLLVVSVFSATVASTESLNQGEEVNVADESINADEPIEIHDWHDLDRVRNHLDGHYILMSDLDEDTDGYYELVGTDKGWEPIGDYHWDFVIEFTGIFDGNGYEIDDLYINRTEEGPFGLFGGIGEEGEVINLAIVNAEIIGFNWVGILAGTNYGGMINNSYATGVVNGKAQVGGLVGNNYGGTIEKSYSIGTVNGKEDVGGLVGRSSGIVRDSYASANVNGRYNIGGLIGRIGKTNSIVENSHYNIDEVLINGGHFITIGGLFDEQYQDWIEDMELNIDDYNDTLKSSGDFYEIGSVRGLKDLLGFSFNEKYKFRLASNLDLSSVPNLHIPYFVGEFDGNYHVISNLSINMPFAAYIGLFGYVRRGIVSYIRLLDVNINGSFNVGPIIGKNAEGTLANSYATGDVSSIYSVGGLVGRNWYGLVDNSHSNSSITSKERRVGGLVGDNRGIVKRSYATGDVSGANSVGGLVGTNTGAVNKSYATGNVSGNGRLGGLVGWNCGSVIGIVKRSYATGDVSGTNSVGGLVGMTSGNVINSYATGNITGEIRRVGGLVGTNRGTVSISYATGGVNGNNQVGGLVGSNIEGTISNSYWEIEISGKKTSDGGTGLTTSEMTGENATIYLEEFDFKEEWETVILDDEDAIEDGYPILQQLSREEQIKNVYPSNMVQTHTLTIIIKGEGSTSPSLGNHSFDDGEIVTLEAIPEDGWVFDEWEGDKIHTNSTINITMDENIQITANFEKEEEKDKDDIPGFLLIKLLLCIAISMVVYGKKKR